MCKDSQYEVYFLVSVFTVGSFLGFGRVEVGKMLWIGVQRDPLFV